MPRWAKAFENIVEKGENADYQRFLIFPQCFLPCQTTSIYITYEIVKYRTFQFGSV